MIFLSPHNDDETLFGAYTLLRFKPYVIVVYRDPENYTIREAETAAAMRVLGCSWGQWPIHHTNHESVRVAEYMARLRPTRVFAPAVENHGHAHHNYVGQLAELMWPGRVTSYLTYTYRDGKSEDGIPSYPRGTDDVAIKRHALACYASQIADPRMSPHFERSQAEYYAR